MNDQGASIQASLDQFGASARDAARVFSGYYRALVEDGIPAKVATGLTAQFHEMWWAKTLGIMDSACSGEG